MCNSYKNNSWLTILRFVSCVLTYFLIGTVIYRFFDMINIEQYWMVIPVLLYFVSIFFIKLYLRYCEAIEFVGAACLLSLILLFCSLNINGLRAWYAAHFEIVAFSIIVLFFIKLVVFKYVKRDQDAITEGGLSNNLFNLFYINTSKVHEIAMLIDNKIMKTVEREQVSEELLKYKSSVTIGLADKWSGETGYSKEDSTKKRVYENFDVKTTKSIMLRKIYETIQRCKDKQANWEVGDLTIFENIELQQRNVDDTIMILNVLQDSDLKNEFNDTIEINLNKMLDTMLDDFTIDYTFTYKEKKYIIQLPYKSTGNFESDYQHNDLQLGKLSLIGIYRGEIDFSERESISSKFLELMSQSYYREINKENNPSSGLKMKLSQTCSNSEDIQFEFYRNRKLKGKLHLIDVIAIIQELNIDRED